MLFLVSLYGQEDTGWLFSQHLKLEQVKYRMSRLANFIGSTLLPYTNPRVMCPPGQPRQHGRRNIIVATPMRSGTHLVIDMILNNIPAYRTRPLYINMDQCLSPRHLSRPFSFLDQITPESGHVIKTHLPIGVDEAGVANPKVAALIESAFVITVHRDHAKIERSLKQWSEKSARGHSPQQDTDDYDRFWQFWQGRESIALRFDGLFDPAAMVQNMERIAEATQTEASSHFRGPMPSHKKLGIFGNKALTRIAGRFAPRIDTTIHTLKA